MQQAAQEYFLKKLQSKPDAADRIVNRVFDTNTVKTIHLTGICGKAMASLAGLLVKAGYTVTGSEAEWNPPMSTVLEHLGISFKPFSAKNIEGIDLLIMGNAYAPSNIEAVEARLRNIPQISSAEAFATFFIKDAQSIVITGTHGKTTTSGLAAHVFINSGTKSNALIGGVIRNIRESYYYGGADPDFSVVEGDEYDTAYFDKAPKFLHYKPTIGVITSIEFDHSDIYDDMDDYLAAFIFFAAEIPPDGYLLISDQVRPEYRAKMYAVCKASVYLYGYDATCDIKITRSTVDHMRGGQVFDIDFFGQFYSKLFTPLFGKYNLENTLAVIAIALKENISEEKVRAAVATFKGTEQRQQIVYNTKNIIVLDDFAHHPTAVTCTIEGVRDQYPDKRIIAVFEPRSVTSRRKDFEVPYSRAFDKADIAILAKPPVRPGDDMTKMMDVTAVVEAIQNRSIEARSFDSTEALFENLIVTAAPGDVFLIMSNGHFDGLTEKFVAWLEKM